MARARNIKPSFFSNEILAECDPYARILFAGLWTIADREGRLEDRPRKIKAELLPYDDCDANILLAELEQRGFIVRYERDDEKYIQIKNFTKHQNPHHMEVASIIPAPDGCGDKYNHSPIGVPQRRRIYERDKHKCVLCGSKDRLHIDHVVAVSRGGTSDDDNLQTLCHPCNLSKGNRDFISLKRQQVIEDEMTSSQSHEEHSAPHPTDSLNLDSPIPHPPSPISDSPKPLPGKKSDPPGADFDDFYKTYPLHKGRDTAVKAYKSAIKRGISHERIVTGARAYAAFVDAEGTEQKFIAHPASWLNGGRWDDDYSAAKKRSAEFKPNSNGIKPTFIDEGKRIAAAFLSGTQPGGQGAAGIGPESDLRTPEAIRENHGKSANSGGRISLGSSGISHEKNP